MWPGGRSAGHTDQAAAGGMASAAGFTPAAGTSFHDEVVRTTADLDAMLALAGVTGAGVGARLADFEAPEVPDTPEGVEAAATPAGREAAATPAGPEAATSGGREAAATSAGVPAGTEQRTSVSAGPRDDAEKNEG